VLLGWKRPMLTLAAVLALAAVTVLSDSGSSVLGLVAALATYALARVAPRLVLGLGLACTMLMLFGAPLVGDLAMHGIPERVMTAIDGSHAEERVGIWQSFGEVARLRPWHGKGFNASGSLATSPVAAEIPEQYRASLSWGHPHNAFLQIWVELGIPGVLLAGLGMFFLFRRLAWQPEAAIPIQVAATAAVLAIAVESHGAWQGWWFAGIGAQIFLFVCFARHQAPATP
jgi:O-antigen ligase